MLDVVMVTETSVVEVDDTIRAILDWRLQQKRLFGGLSLVNVNLKSSLLEK